MNFRLSAILFGIIFVLGVVLLVMSFTGDDKPPTSTLLEELAGVKANEIDTVEFERGGGARMKIVRAGGQWNIVEPYAARADSGAVTGLISALRGAKPVAFAGMSSDPAAHGLQPAGLRVILRAGEKSSAINFGDVGLGEGGGVVFVTTSARPKRPMAVSRSAVEPLFQRSSVVGKTSDLAKWVGDFRARQVFAGDTHGMGDDTVRVSLTHNNKNLTLERSGAGWKFVNPAGWGDADPIGDVASTSGTFTGVNRLLNTLTNMQAGSAADFVENPGAEELERYGVNENSPGVVKVELKNKDGETTTAFIGKKDVPAAPSPPPRPGMPETGKWWVRVVGQQGVVRASAGDLGGLAATIENPDPLRDRTLLTVDRGRIDGLDLANGATKLRKTGVHAPSWKLYGKPEYGDPQPAAGVDRILDVLMERRTVKSFPAANIANFAPGELKATLRVWVDGFETSTDPKADPKAEPKETGKPIVLEFGKAEPDGTIHVRRTLADGTPTYFLMPAKVTVPPAGEPVDLLATAGTSRLKLLDQSLKGFASTVATRLTVSGTANYEVERPETPDPSARRAAWRFVKPDDRKGKTADADTVDDMLTTLANTHTATALVDENPSPEKLAAYGLGPVPGRPAMPGDPPAPRLRVVVGLKDGPKDEPDAKREYEFGDKFPGDANLVYARQTGRAVVFTVPKFVADKFSADLRDKTIFQFNPATVTAIEFKGWSKTGFEVELHFGKNKDQEWVVTKSPGAYNLDPAKVDAFLRTLGSTRVKSFVPGERTREQGLFDDGKPDQKDNLSVLVRMVVNGKADPGIHLILGNPTDGGASYFGWTSRVAPPAVFTIDAAPFKAYREGPGAFAK
jgi:hypothetical protein